MIEQYRFDYFSTENLGNELVIVIVLLICFAFATALTYMFTNEFQIKLIGLVFSIVILFVYFFQDFQDTTIFTEFYLVLALVIIAVLSYSVFNGGNENE